ncbi:XRE family transcriptional regulator [Photobacterium jeanii]|uniref:XRE family transcriptional regulator n=1 Tax=Photobacterium jeanii TaxID=858640 RepID=A0A178K7A1_9GAMM|nr:response regulator transcription factor [Photobacterium jeanii]OAN13171.1 XRE family transcriptional regulator [Photobacterium jeanii]PST89323.1 DNA-binding response regulator [Photobacterium jeanii]
MIVLMIEDDKVLASALSDYLALDDIELDYAYNGESGLKLATENAYDVILLDIMLPKLNGFSVCKALRERGISTPVLMMTARDSLDDKLEGFNVGTDDYITKPFAMAELYARLHALVKRSKGKVATRIQIEDLTLDLDNHQAYRGDTSLILSPQSWKILLVLAQRSPAVVTREELEQEVWGDEISTNNLKVQIHKLRQSVDKPFAFSLIQSVPKVGFVLRREHSC